MHSQPYNQRLLKSLLENAEVLGLSRAARLRLGWFLYAVGHQWNVSLTCRHFGIARSTFVRWAERFDPKNPETLEEQSRCPHTVREANEDPTVVAFIECCRREDPYANKEAVCDRLRLERGVTLSASTVGRIIQRHCFFFGSTPAHRAKRMQSVDTTLTPPTTPVPPLDDDAGGANGDASSFGIAPVFG
jgi:transposase